MSCLIPARCALSSSGPLLTRACLFNTPHYQPDLDCEPAGQVITGLLHARIQTVPSLFPSELPARCLAHALACSAPLLP
eukprot:1161208-Pelagomonas_calceolata.AAC.6